ncbi:hypothetical protein [Arcticibacter sp.]|uniref:hypothetical protein n=1 Tax=Arcticibacter sp. TaxID=1872630 RepID=UPI003890ECF2
MTFKRLILFVLMGFYLYSLTFGIFMTGFFRIPAPAVFITPLFLFFRDKTIAFLYRKEVMLFTIAAFFYYAVGQHDLKSFLAYSFVVLICAVYFNFIVGSNAVRFQYSVLIFFSLLLLSALIMVLNHFFVSESIKIRELIMGEQVLQSPSGISTTIFTFGYQLAALVSFAFIYSFTYRKPFIWKPIVFLACSVLIFLGMNRSVFVAFVFTSLLFLLFYEGFKAVFIIGILLAVGYGSYTYVVKESLDTKNNIVTKNEENDARFNRSGLTLENIKIVGNYPYGLIFYGKTWKEVVYRNHVFSSGLTSHNAYLMFVTYLGPFLGIGLLIALYFKVLKVLKLVIQNIKVRENSLIVCLCFSFLAVSINALSHNAWLISADGPTVFLYFSLLHSYKMKMIHVPA